MESKIANRILLAGASLALSSVFWLYVLGWIKAIYDMDSGIKLLLGLIVTSVIATDWFFYRRKLTKSDAIE